VFQFALFGDLFGLLQLKLLLLEFGTFALAFLFGPCSLLLLNLQFSVGRLLGFFELLLLGLSALPGFLNLLELLLGLLHHSIGVVSSLLEVRFPLVRSEGFWLRGACVRQGLSLLLPRRCELQLQLLCCWRLELDLWQSQLLLAQSRLHRHGQWFSGRLHWRLWQLRQRCWRVAGHSHWLVTLRFLCLELRNCLSENLCLQCSHLVSLSLRFGGSLRLGLLGNEVPDVLSWAGRLHHIFHYCFD
jgi:hypothetical protein